MTGSAHNGIKVVKVNNRYLVGKDALLERNSISPLNLVKRVDRKVVVFPSTSSNNLRVKVYDPLRGQAELEVIKSKEKLRHG
jgi:hypothetical protein